MIRTPLRSLLLALLLCAAMTGHAHALHSGNIVIIEDTFGNILPEEGMCDNILFAQGLCVNHAAMAFYKDYGDNYDVLVLFTTKQLMSLFNVAMGFPVQQTAQGIGLKPPHPFAPWQFGSAGRLIQCVKMGDLGALPDNPHELVALPPITGLELVAHEVGHQWLVWLTLDLNDGRGAIPILRGYEGDSPNGHWSSWYNSGSVMYGGILTDNGDGTFTHTNGPRKYSQLDQYLMGLRTAEQLEPQWYVDVDGSSEGSPAMPGYPGTTHTFSGTRVDFTAADIIRANGPRVPELAPCHLKFAFVLIHEPGLPPFPAQIEKVDNYRIALEKWWPEGTDYLGSIDTRLSGCGEGTGSCEGDPSPQCTTWVDEEDPNENKDCTQGETRCASLFEVQICKADSTWQSLIHCEENERCDEGACKRLDDETPDGDTPDGDTPDGDGGKPDGDAPDGDAPDGDYTPDGDIVEETCVPGAFRCRGEIRERCSTNETTWLVEEDCAEKGQVCTLEACIDDPNGSGGGCRTNGRGGLPLAALALFALLFVRWVGATRRDERA